MSQISDSSLKSYIQFSSTTPKSQKASFDSAANEMACNTCLSCRLAPIKGRTLWQYPSSGPVLNYSRLCVCSSDSPQPSRGETPAVWHLHWCDNQGPKSWRALISPLTILRKRKMDVQWGWGGGKKMRVGDGCMRAKHKNRWKRDERQADSLSVNMVETAQPDPFDGLIALAACVPIAVIPEDEPRRPSSRDGKPTDATLEWQWISRNHGKCLFKKTTGKDDGKTPLQQRLNN